MTSKKPSHISTILNNKLSKALENIGIEKWTPIQNAIIPFLLSNDANVIALSKTGSGKTASFGVPIINRICSLKEYKKHNKPSLYSIIIAPTHELCLQITNALNDFSMYMDNISITAVYGGSDIATQIKSIKQGTDIIVATPGRLIDIIRRKVLTLNSINTVVIDEADKMFDMGFIEEIIDILHYMPEHANVWMFSATMQRQLKDVIEKHITTPHIFDLSSKNILAENIENIFFVVENQNKIEALKRIISFYPNIYAIIFCKTKKIADEVTVKLISSNYKVDALHGDLSQEQRNEVMAKFRCKMINLLVATDVAARGIDIENLTHVIHFNIPDDAETYIHRSGRTGRINNKGTSVSIINVREQFKLQLIANKLNVTFSHQKVPSKADICQQQTYSFVDKLLTDNYDQSFHSIKDKISENIVSLFENRSKEELIKQIISLNINELSKHALSNNDLNINNIEEIYKQEQERFEHSKTLIDDAIRNSSDGFVIVSINIGHATGTVPARIIGLINDTVRHKIKIGKIDIYDEYSTIEVEAKFLEMLISSFEERCDARYIIEVISNK